MQTNETADEYPFRRKPDIQHTEYAEPAVARWAEALEARKIYGGKPDGNKGVPKRRKAGSKWVR